MPVTRRKRFGRRISNYLRRFDAPGDEQIGIEVPSGWPIRGGHLALVAIALLVGGCVVLVDGSRVHHRLALVVALWLGAVLFFAIARNPRRWL